VGDIHSAELLTIAANITTAQLDKMAHALGWPDSLNAGRRGGRIRWRNPYRNGWSGSSDDPEWNAAESSGLAVPRVPEPVCPHTYWSVTPLGIVVVELRLRALLYARRLNAEEVPRG